MSNGYLGKISAIVTANTGDFKPKLDAAAADVTKFSKTIESTLRAASNESSKAFAGIYTQAQQVERALNAAFTMKLSFKGFAGAIKDVDQLKLRLADLSKRQIDISVVGTAFKTVSDLREAIMEISNADMAWIKSLGGLSSARILAPAMNAKEMARLQKFDNVDSTSDIERAIDVISRGQFEAAATKMRQLVSATKEVYEPLRASAEAVQRLSMEVQESLHPALKATQKEAARLGESIDSGMADVASKFDRAAEAAKRFAEAERAVAEAGEMLGSINSGGGLKFQNPAVYDALNAARTSQANAGSLPLSDQRRLSVGDVFSRQSVAGKAVAEAQAELEAVRVRRDAIAASSRATPGRMAVADAAVGNAEADLQKKLTILQDITDELERQVLLTKQFNEMQGNPAGTFGPAPPPGSRVNSMGQTVVPVDRNWHSLGASSLFFPGSRPGAPTGAFGPSPPPGSRVSGSGQTIVPVDRNWHSLGASSQFFPGSTSGNPTGTFGPQMSPAMIQARQEAQALEDAIDQLRSKSNFTISGNVQSVKQAEAEISRLISLISTLDGKQKSALRGNVNAAINSLRSGDVGRIQAAIGALQGKMTGMGVAGVKSGDIGRMGLDKFTLAVQQAGFAIDDFFSVTGDFSQRMRAIGNNVSQLGFILGGATGLFVALGVTIGTQVSLMISKYVFGLEDAKDKQERLKTMTDVLNSSFEEQKKIVESLANAYEKLPKAIRDATLPEANKRAVDRKETAADIRKTQADARREMLATTVPEIAELRSRRAALEKQLSEGGSDFAAQADLRSRIKFTVDRENDLVRRIEGDAAARVKAGDPMLNERTRDVFTGSVLEQVRERNRLVAAADESGRVADTDAVDINIRDMSRTAGELTVGLQQIKDAAALAAFEFTGPLTDSIAAAQREIESLGEFVNKDTRDAVTRAGFELADAAKRAADGSLSQEAFKREVSRISQNVQNTREEIDYGASFKKSMEDQQRAIEQARQEAESSAGRGRDLAITPGQRAGRELSEGLLDIRRRFGQVAEEGGGLVDEAGILGSQKRLVQERMRAAAPGIFSLADSVENAIVQGPSRAALQANDITTAQGAAELNRLLRGDDSAKNQDLVELQKQSKSLEELVNYARQNGAPPGIFD